MKLLSDYIAERADLLRINVRTLAIRLTVLALMLVVSGLPNEGDWGVEPHPTR